MQQELTKPALMVEDGNLKTEVYPAGSADAHGVILWAITITHDKSGQKWQCKYEYINGSLRANFACPQPLISGLIGHTRPTLGEIADSAKAAAYQLGRDSWIAVERAAVAEYVRDIDHTLEQSKRQTARLQAKLQAAFEWLDSIK